MYKRQGVHFTMEAKDGAVEITAEGKGAHASTPQEGVNALTGLLELLTGLPFAACPQVDGLKKIAALMPHGDFYGKGLGVDMEDELSGRLTLAFTMPVSYTHLDVYKRQDKSAHMGYDRIVCLMEQKRGAVHWIKCFEGQNALDFQLVTELGSCLSQNGSREYIIVSNDTGYDAVVRYWQQKGCSVRRIKGTDCEKGAPEERRQEEKAEKAVSEKKGRNNKSEKVGAAARVHGEEPAAQKSCAEKNCGEEPILQELSLIHI